MQISNDYYPALDEIEFDDLHYRFSIIVTLLEGELIFMAFIIDSQLLLPCLR